MFAIFSNKVIWVIQSWCYLVLSITSHLVITSLCCIDLLMCTISVFCRYNFSPYTNFYLIPPYTGKFSQLVHNYQGTKEGFLYQIENLKCLRIWICLKLLHGMRDIYHPSIVAKIHSIKFIREVWYRRIRIKWILSLFIFTSCSVGSTSQ